MRPPLLIRLPLGALLLTAALAVAVLLSVAHGLHGWQVAPLPISLVIDGQDVGAGLQQQLAGSGLAGAALLCLAAVLLGLALFLPLLLLGTLLLGLLGLGALLLTVLGAPLLALGLVAALLLAPTVLVVLLLAGLLRWLLR